MAIWVHMSTWMNGEFSPFLNSACLMNSSFSSKQKKGSRIKIDTASLWRIAQNNYFSNHVGMGKRNPHQDCRRPQNAKCGKCGPQANLALLKHLTIFPQPVDNAVLASHLIRNRWYYCRKQKQYSVPASSHTARLTLHNSSVTSGSISVKMLKIRSRDIHAEAFRRLFL